MYSKKNEKKKIVETEATLREKPQSISTKSWKKMKGKKIKEKKIKGKNKGERIYVMYKDNKYLINFETNYCISQPFTICTLFYFLYGCENTKKCSKLS